MKNPFSSKKKKLKIKYNSEQLKDMMENRLRANFIPSGKRYKRKQKRNRSFD